MDLKAHLADKTLKGIEKRTRIVDALLDGRLTTQALCEAADHLDAKQAVLLMEALEEVSRKPLMPLDARCLALAVDHLDSPHNGMKREAARVVGNLAAQHPDLLAPALPRLWTLTRHEGKVIRWAGAYALSRIVQLPQYARSELYDQLTALAQQETDNGVKQQYVKGLRQAAKLRP